MSQIKCVECDILFEATLFDYGLFCSKECRAKDIDCSATDEIVCPHCGYEFSDSHEDCTGESEVECGDCEKKFTATAEYSVSYYSYKKKDNA